MLHLSRGMLLLPWLLLLLTSCADSIIEPCGGNASFVWDYEVPAFIAVEWYFENTQIAITLGEELSQDTIKINDVYKSRFVLLEKDKTGFTLINVTGTDEGNYTCTLTLQSTDIPKELKKTLNVTDCDTHGTSTSRPGEGTTTPTPTVPEGHNTLAIVLGVVGVLVVGGIALGMYGVRRYKKRRSREREPDASAPMNLRT